MGVLQVGVVSVLLVALPPEEFPFEEEGLSSLDFRLLSDGLGTKKAVGEVDGVILVAPIELFLDVLPFDPPFRSLL